MSRQSWLSRIYWSKLAKPTQERVLFSYLVNHPISSVLEIGVGDGARMRRISKLFNLTPGTDQLRYLGVDEFESSSKSNHLKLKDAHRLASQLGFKASLIPGTPQSAIPRVAHKFGPSDLVIINGGIDLNNPTVGAIGSWLNRLAHSRSAVIASQAVGGQMVLIDSASLELPIVKAA